MIIKTKLSTSILRKLITIQRVKKVMILNMWDYKLYFYKKGTSFLPTKFNEYLIRFLMFYIKSTVEGDTVLVILNIGVM